MGGDISAGDLLTMHKWNNRDAELCIYNDQRNLPSAKKISIVGNKESKEIKKPRYIEKNRTPKMKLC